MASRNMVEANQKIFRRLDEFCAGRDQQLTHQGKQRYISTTEADKAFLKTAVLMDVLTLSRTTKIARFLFEGQDVLVTAGLDLPDELQSFFSEQITAGHLTTFVAESSLHPRASAPEVRNVVDIGFRGEENYTGVELAEMSSLYAPLRAFSRERTDDSSYRFFFMLCLHDERVNEWMDSELISELIRLANINPVSLPYRTLCRSIFDMDSGALFLALYRCLEALYAFSYTSPLRQALSIETPWDELARLLERNLGWWPREEPSLAALLAKADTPTLEALISLFPEGIPADGDRADQATKRIYSLRNSLVHYRPAHAESDHDAYDWNKLSIAMVGLVLHIYQAVIATAVAS